MAKFIVDIEKIVRYSIEVDAKTAKQAQKKAEKMFWEEPDAYEDMCDVEFGDVTEVDEA